MRAARIIPAVLFLMILAVGCDGGGQPPDAAPAVLRIPGVMTGPDGMTVDVSGENEVILYYWMPLDGYGDVDSELAELASRPDTASRVFPVQFSNGERNTAQSAVNSLGISLPVFLADASLASAIPLDILPVAVLFRRGAPPLVETGFGCVQRLPGS